MASRRSLFALLALGVSVLPLASAASAASVGAPAQMTTGAARGTAWSAGVRGSGLRPATTRGTSVGATACAWMPVTGTAALAGSDLNAHYWMAVLWATPSVTLRIAGTYPAARYASFQAYTLPGAFLTGLADKDFPPDSGAVNPFASGGQRGQSGDTYTVHVVFGPAPGQPVSGTLYINQPPGALVSLVYRIYLPDAAATPAGSVPLPTITAWSNGAPAPCPGLTALSSRAGTHPAGASATLPRSMDGVASVPNAASQPGFTRLGPGGVYGNADAAYLTAVLTSAPLYVVRFQVPTTPRTLAGESFDPATQLRYWSLCVYTWTDAPYKCLADEQVPSDQLGTVTVVLGPWWARPTNATAANHVVWVSLNWFLTPYLVILRHMLPASNYSYSAFAVPYGSGPSPYMGPYAPTVTQCTTAQFQQNECRS